MRKITMSSAAFGAVLHLLGRAGKYLLPQQKNVENFLAGREELCKNGWAQLDFDSSLLPESAFARLIYDISHAEAVLRFNQEAQTIWVLLAPTEMLYIEQNGEEVRLERRKAAFLFPWVREILMPAKNGQLTTQRKEDVRNSTLEDVQAESRERAEMLACHLALFFDKEET